MIRDQHSLQVWASAKAEALARDCQVSSELIRSLANQIVPDGHQGDSPWQELDDLAEALRKAHSALEEAQRRVDLTIDGRGKAIEAIERKIDIEEGRL